MRSEPGLKAERLVKVWNGLEAEYERINEQLSGRERIEERGKVEERMKEVAGELKSDLRLEAQLRTRAKELGIEAGAWLDRVIKEPNIEWAIRRGPDRGGYERDGPGDWSR